MLHEMLVIATIVVTGLMVGVELAVAAFVNPIFDRLPDNGGLSARSDGARVLGKVMPWWYVTSVILAVVWGIQTWGQQQAGTVVGATLLLLISVLMSVALLVPINSQVARWSAANVPADWRQQVGRWDRFHFVRVGVIVTAFVLLVMAGTWS